jgi:hypothetical protein
LELDCSPSILAARGCSGDILDRFEAIALARGHDSVRGAWQIVDALAAFGPANRREI